MAISKLGILTGAIVAVLVGALLLLANLPEAPRTFMNQRRAVASLQSLTLAELTYSQSHPATGFACSLANLSARSEDASSGAGLIDPVLASGTKSAYHFEIACPETGAQSKAAYQITAVPTQPGTTGIFALCTDQSGAIWYSANGSTAECLAQRKPVEQKYR